MDSIYFADSSAGRTEIASPIASTGRVRSYARKASEAFGTFEEFPVEIEEEEVQAEEVAELSMRPKILKSLKKTGYRASLQAFEERPRDFDWNQLPFDKK